jgi:hypothetical protein
MMIPTEWINYSFVAPNDWTITCSRPRSTAKKCGWESSCIMERFCPAWRDWRFPILGASLDGWLCGTSHPRLIRWGGLPSYERQLKSDLLLFICFRCFRYARLDGSIPLFSYRLRRRRIDSGRIKILSTIQAASSPTPSLVKIKLQETKSSGCGPVCNRAVKKPFLPSKE